jgi:hypothetical protein
MFKGFSRSAFPAIEEISSNNAKVHLLAREIVICERPQAKDVDLKKDAEREVLTLLALQAFCEKNAGMSIADARKLFSDNAEEYQINDYLTPDQLRSKLELEGGYEDRAINTATLMLANRLMYPLVVAEDTKAGDRSIKILEAYFDVSPGQIFKSKDHGCIKIETIVDEGSVVLENPLAAAAPAGTAFYLCDNGRFVVGDDGWDSDRTESTMPISMIGKLNDFYYSCLSRFSTTQASEGKAGAEEPVTVKAMKTKQQKAA